MNLDEYIILFLDLDGVMHGFHGRRTLVHVERFEKILEDNPNVKVVFSTSWRFNQSFQTLVSYFSKHLHDRFIGVNPTVQTEWPPYVKHERYKECVEYMNINNFTGPWVAIDDAKDLFPEGCLNLVLTEGHIGIDDRSEQELRGLLASFSSLTC
jgi:hypothetical protein